MDVIQGTSKPKQRRRWWRQRPHLRLVEGTDPKRAAQGEDDGLVVAVVGTLCLQAVFFAVRVGTMTLE